MLPPNSNNAFTTSGIFMRFPQLERARHAVAPMGCRLFDRVGNGVARAIAIGRLLSATKAACKVVQRAGRSTIGGHLRQSSLAREECPTRKRTPSGSSSMTPGVLAWWRTNAARTRFTPAISDRLASALAARTTARGNFIARRSDSTALSAGQKLQKEGHPIGLGFGQTTDSIDWVGAAFHSFGADLVNEKGDIIIKQNDAVKQVLEYMQRLAKVMPQDVFAWDDASNNKYIISGQGSLIFNPPSAYAVAKRDNR